LKDGRHPKLVQETEAIDNFVSTKGLRYYNADIHHASFALPNFVKALINGK
jgi:spermidine synthase